MKRSAILIFVFAVTVGFVRDAEARNFRRAKVRTRTKTNTPVIEKESLPDSQAVLETALGKLRQKPETVPLENAALDEWNLYAEKWPKIHSPSVTRIYNIWENGFDADAALRAWQGKAEPRGYVEILTASDAKRVETVLANIRDNAENKHPDRILAETQYETGMTEYLAPNVQRKSLVLPEGYFIGSIFR